MINGTKSMKKKVNQIIKVKENIAERLKLRR